MGTTGEAYGEWADRKQPEGLARGTMADDGGVAGSGRGVLRPMVLPAARMARFPRGNRRRGALAMAGGGPVGAGICRGPALCLGFRMDGTRHTRAHCSAAAVGGGGVLSLCEKSHVPG